MSDAGTNAAAVPSRDATRIDFTMVEFCCLTSQMDVAIGTVFWQVNFYGRLEVIIQRSRDKSYGAIQSRVSHEMMPSKKTPDSQTDCIVTDRLNSVSTLPLPLDLSCHLVIRYLIEKSSLS